MNTKKIILGTTDGKKHHLSVSVPVYNQIRRQLARNMEADRRNTTILVIKDAEDNHIFRSPVNAIKPYIMEV